jgi:hypothetical protein
VGDHPSSEPVAVEAVSHRDYLAADPVSRDVRRAYREAAHAMAGADSGVDEHHIACGDGHDKLAGSGYRVGQVRRNKDFRSAEASYLDSTHGLRPSPAAQRSPADHETADPDARDRR